MTKEDLSLYEQKDTFVKQSFYEILLNFLIQHNCHFVSKNNRKVEKNWLTVC